MDGRYSTSIQSGGTPPSRVADGRIDPDHTPGERGSRVDTGATRRRVPAAESPGTGIHLVTAVVILWLLLASGMILPAGLAGQTPGGTATQQDSAFVPDSIPPDPPVEKKPPVYAVLGLGYGSRNDACVLCESPSDNQSFTGHLSVGRPLGHGFGVGADVSVWRRARPGTPLPADSSGVPGETVLANTLGNLSVSFSYDIWHLYVRAGGGLSYGSQDLEATDANGNLMVHTASGWGVGYSAGIGLTVPVASVVSVAFFGNWNVGRYDMISPQGLTERAARHEYLEFGVGVAVR